MVAASTWSIDRLVILVPLLLVVAAELLPCGVIGVVLHEIGHIIQHVLDHVFSVAGLPRVVLFFLELLLHFLGEEIDVDVLLDFGEELIVRWLLGCC